MIKSETKDLCNKFVVFISYRLAKSELISIREIDNRHICSICFCAGTIFQLYSPEGGTETDLAHLPVGIAQAIAGPHNVSDLFPLLHRQFQNTLLKPLPCAVQCVNSVPFISERFAAEYHSINHVFINSKLLPEPIIGFVLFWLVKKALFQNVKSN